MVLPGKERSYALGKQSLTFVKGAFVSLVFACSSHNRADSLKSARRAASHLANEDVLRKVSKGRTQPICRWSPLRTYISALLGGLRPLAEFTDQCGCARAILYQSLLLLSLVCPAVKVFPVNIENGRLLHLLEPDAELSIQRSSAPSILKACFWRTTRQFKWTRGLFARSDL